MGKDREEVEQPATGTGVSRCAQIANVKTTKTDGRIEDVIQ